METSYYQFFFIFFYTLSSLSNFKLTQIFRHGWRYTQFLRTEWCSSYSAQRNRVKHRSLGLKEPSLMELRMENYYLCTIQHTPMNFIEWNGNHPRLPWTSNLEGYHKMYARATYQKISSFWLQFASPEQTEVFSSSDSPEIWIVAKLYVQEQYIKQSAQSDTQFIM